jgi:hypothetical protein
MNDEREKLMCSLERTLLTYEGAQGLLSRFRWCASPPQKSRTDGASLSFLLLSRPTAIRISNRWQRQSTRAGERAHARERAHAKERVREQEQEQEQEQEREKGR